MEFLYVLIAIVALILGYFLFVRKGGAPKTFDAPGGAEPRIEPRPAPPKRVAKTPRSEAEALDIDVQPEEAAPRREAEPSRPSLHRETNVTSLRKGLAKSRAAEGFFGKLKQLIGSKRSLDPAIAEEIEEILLGSDVGVKTTEAMLERIRDGLNKGDLNDSTKVFDALRQEALRILEAAGPSGTFLLRDRPTVVLMVGVNGSGKTTTIGKLATQLKGEGKHVVLAAGDTFRAAAVQQLSVWADRVGCEVVRGKDRADPSSVVFDAIKTASDSRADVVLADTAGRLHTKTNLMAEMTKVYKTAGKALSGAPHETLLVIDATNGQNALAQAKEFKEALPLTGIVLTKLDGTAKGGVVLGICDELKLPVRFVGLGERPDDLHEFKAEAFVEALLGREAEANAA